MFELLSMNVQLQLCLLLWCGAAEGFTDKLVVLGQNVTLDCDISVRNVYWFLMKPSQPPVYILQSYARTSTVANFQNSTLKERFSVQINSSLFIYNITKNQLGMYYCILNGTPPTIGTGTRIQATSKSSTDHLNQTEENQQLKNQTCSEEPGLQQTLLLISSLQICVLLVAVIGVMTSHCRESPNGRLSASSQQCSGMQQDLFSVLVQEGLQAGRRRNSFTVVEFTQLSSEL